MRIEPCHKRAGAILAGEVAPGAARRHLPLSDVRLDLLVPSTTSTSCPYEVRGRRYEDVVWIYRTPLPESQLIAGLACFYAERVDLYVDEVLQDRPVSPFS